MKNHENAPTTNAQILELGAMMLRQIPRDLGSERVKFLIENPNAIREVLVGLREPRRCEDFKGDICADWQDFCSRVFGLKVDLSEVKIPDKKPGFDRVIFVPKSLSAGQAIDACRKRFKVYSYMDDLDRDVPTNDRSPENGTYAIRVRDCREADEKLKSRSANDLKADNIPGITLLERLVLELKYHYETGEHLDMENITLCSGSRYSGGVVPYVYWHDGRLHVRWLHPYRADGNLRSRAVVSV